MSLSQIALFSHDVFAYSTEVAVTDIAQSIKEIFRQLRDNRDQSKEVEMVLKQISNLSVPQLNRQDKEQNTLLHLVCQNCTKLEQECHEQQQFFLTLIVKEILKRRSPNVLNNECKTPLHLICENISNGTGAIIDELISHGARLDIRDKQYNLPLHSICSNEHASAGLIIEIIGLLLSRGARIDDKNLEGETAIEIALKNGHFEAGQFLLSKGAEVSREFLEKARMDLKTPRKIYQQILELFSQTDPAASFGAAHVMDSWYKELDGETSTDERLELIDKTARLVKHLNNPKQDLKALQEDQARRQCIMNKFIQSKENNNKLAQWVARYKNPHNQGPYESIKGLLECTKNGGAIDSSLFKEFDDSLSNFDSDVLVYDDLIYEKARLPEHYDIENVIFSYLDKQDLLALRSTSKYYQARINASLGNPLNTDQPVIEFANLTHLTKFFDSDCKTLTHIKLACLKERELIDTKNFPKLQYLEIKGSVTQEQCKQLATLTTLKTLFLNNCLISDFSFLTELKELKHLKLKLGQQEDINYLKNSAELEKLSLWGDGQNIDLTILESLKNLKELRISDMVRSNFDFLKDYPKLEIFMYFSKDNKPINTEGLGYCKKLINVIVQAQGVTALSSLSSSKQLQTLILNCPGLSDFSFIQSMHSLKKFLLQENPGVNNLDFLRNCSKLNEVILKNCNQLIDLSHLGNHKGLQILKVEKCPANNYLFLLQIDDLRTLEINGLQSPNLAGLMKQSKNLKTLKIYNCTEVKHLNLSSFNNLNILQLSKLDKSFENDSLFPRECINLNELDLSGNIRLNKKCFSFLKHNKKIKSIVCSYYDSVGPIEGLTKCKGLQILKLCECKLNNVSDANFLKGLENLKSLDLAKCSDIFPTINALTRLTNLRKLNLFGCKDIIQGLSFLRNCKKLFSLDLGNCKIVDYSWLKELKGLQRLSLKKCKFLDLSGREDGVLDLSFLKALKDLVLLDITEVNLPAGIDIKSLAAKYPALSIIH